MAVINRRMATHIEGDFVVFLIGMRVNRPWRVWSWLPVFLAMPRMLRELAAHPEAGCLGTEASFPAIIQYWRSFDHLEAYARSRDAAHFPAWAAFNRAVAASGDVGIWHETYLVGTGQYETLYNHVPPRGLGKASTLVEASGARSTAAGRLGRPGAGGAPGAAAGER